MSVLMGLGPLRFSMSTLAYDELSRSLSVRAESQPIILARPSIHYLGPGDEEVSISGVYYPYFISGRGLAQLQSMYSLAAMGARMMMVSGGGRVFGRFIIRSVDNADTFLLSDGQAQKIEFSCTLVRAGGFSPLGIF